MAVSQFILSSSEKPFSPLAHKRAWQGCMFFRPNFWQKYVDILHFSSLWEASIWIDLIFWNWLWVNLQVCVADFLPSQDASKLVAGTQARKILRHHFIYQFDWLPFYSDPHSSTQIFCWHCVWENDWGCAIGLAHVYFPYFWRYIWRWSDSWLLSKVLLTRLALII